MCESVEEGEAILKASILTAEGGLNPPETNPIICFTDTIIKSLISVLSRLYYRLK